MKVCEEKFEVCCNIYTSSQIVRSENKKTFRVKNPQCKEVAVCDVDGCLITGDIKRCDFLFKVADEVIYLVELKGTDHSRALEQLVSAAEVLNVLSFSGRRLTAIVGSPCPKASTKYQKALKSYASRFRKAGIEFPVRKNDILEVVA